MTRKDKIDFIVKHILGSKASDFIYYTDEDVDYWYNEYKRMDDTLKKCYTM